MSGEDGELWERADTVLACLLEVPEADRPAALEALQLPAELESSVRRLLRAHARAGALDHGFKYPGTPSE